MLIIVSSILTPLLLKTLYKKFPHTELPEVSMNIMKDADDFSHFAAGAVAQTVNPADASGSVVETAENTAEAQPVTVVEKDTVADAQVETEEEK